MLYLLVRHFKELLQQSKIIHQLEGGRMDRVSAKVAIEVFMFLKYNDLHTGPC
jgi:hypothetical protein